MIGGTYLNIAIIVIKYGGIYKLKFVCEVQVSLMGCHRND